MFNSKYIRAVMDRYNCNQFAVDADGNVFAMAPERQILIPGLVFDTDTVDGTLAQEAIAKAKAE